MEDFIEDLRNYYYDEQYEDVQIEGNNFNEVCMYLDLPSTYNYTVHMNLLDKFFDDNDYDIENYFIDGDYEGVITISFS